MSKYPEPIRKVDGADRLMEVLGFDGYRMTLLPNDLPPPIVDAFTEAEKEAAFSACRPPR